MTAHETYKCSYPNCELRRTEEIIVTEKTCVERHKRLEEDNVAMDKRIEKIESREWRATGAFVLMLLAAVGTLVMQYFNKPDSQAIAAQVVNLMHHPHP